MQGRVCYRGVYRWAGRYEVRVHLMGGILSPKEGNYCIERRLPAKYNEIRFDMQRIIINQNLEIAYIVCILPKYCYIIVIWIYVA